MTNLDVNSAAAYLAKYLADRLKGKVLFNHSITDPCEAARHGFEVVHASYIKVLPADFDQVVKRGSNALAELLLARDGFLAFANGAFLCKRACDVGLAEYKHVRTRVTAWLDSDGISVQLDVCCLSNKEAA